MAITLFENTYVNLVTADAMLEHHSTGWFTLTEAQRESYLVQSASMIDQYVDWIGRALDPGQAMAFPREKLSYLDPVLQLEVMVKEDEVPVPVQVAQVFLALHLSENADQLEPSAQKFGQISVGPISLSETAVSAAQQVPRIPKTVRDRLAPFSRSGALSSRQWWRAN